MKKPISNNDKIQKTSEKPLLSDVWIVTHESEGIILEAFESYQAALSKAQDMASKHSSLRTEIARYSIAPHTLKSLGKENTDDIEIEE